MGGRTPRPLWMQTAAAAGEKAMNSLYASLGTTVFETMSRLAAEKGAVNLGQGFPEDDGPRDILEAAARATLEGPNQYPSMRGLPELRQAVAAHYNAHHALDLDWTSEVTITSGATEAIAAALLAEDPATIEHEGAKGFRALADMVGADRLALAAQADVVHTGTIDFASIAGSWRRRSQSSAISSSDR